MIKGLVSKKAQNWETICTSEGGLKSGFSDAKGAWLLRNFRGQVPGPRVFPKTSSKRGRSLTLALSSFKIS